MKQNRLSVELNRTIPTCKSTVPGTQIELNRHVARLFAGLNLAFMSRQMSLPKNSKIPGHKLSRQAKRARPKLCLTAFSCYANRQRAAGSPAASRAIVSGLRGGLLSGSRTSHT